MPRLPRSDTWIRRIGVATDATAGHTPRRDAFAVAEQFLAACLQVAIWHGRYDLASAAAGRLLQEDVPPEMSRAQLHFARLAYGGLALADRLGARLRRRPKEAVRA